CRAPIADVEYRFLAIVAAEFPSHQRGVEGGLFVNIRHVEGDVVERDCLPPRWCEGRLDGRGRDLTSEGTCRRAVPIAASPLRECGDGSQCDSGEDSE